MFAQITRVFPEKKIDLYLLFENYVNATLARPRTISYTSGQQHVRQERKHFLPIPRPPAETSFCAHHEEQGDGTGEAEKEEDRSRRAEKVTTEISDLGRKKKFSGDRLDIRRRRGRGGRRVSPKFWDPIEGEGKGRRGESVRKT